MISSKFDLRTVTMEDAKLLFDWRNDPCVRDNSFHSEPIEYANHVKWLTATLQDVHQQFFVLETTDGTAGQVRIQIQGNTGLISYSIAAAFRGAAGHRPA